MKKFLVNQLKAKKIFILFGLFFAFSVFDRAETFAQKRGANSSGKKVSVKKTVKIAAANLPKVTQIDDIALKNLLKREGEAAKPLLINFWATWCDPCREEFPDLVKIDAQYKGKIDFITVSLDPLSEIGRDVPKFLAAMKAEMPAYLLKTTSEESAIAAVSKQWQGGLPFTILFNEKGETVYSRQGKVKIQVLLSEIDKILVEQIAQTLDDDTKLQIKILHDIANLTDPFQKGERDAQEDILFGKLQIINKGERSAANAKLAKLLADKYGIKTFEFGCKMTTKLIEYIKGYNNITEMEIKRKFGDKALEISVEN
jgi:thiol-disulfide isomerase/thioredoxin